VTDIHSLKDILLHIRSAEMSLKILCKYFFNFIMNNSIKITVTAHTQLLIVFSAAQSAAEIYFTTKNESSQKINVSKTPCYYYNGRYTLNDKENT